MPTTARRPLPNTYFELVRRFPLARITDDTGLSDALTVLDDLLTLEVDAGREAYLGALSTLVHAYESRYHPIPDATPAEILRELADGNGMTGAAVAERSRIAASTISALMSGKRRPTPEQMIALAAVFGVSPAAFLSTARSDRQREQQMTLFEEPSKLNAPRSSTRTAPA